MDGSITHARCDVAILGAGAAGMMAAVAAGETLTGASGAEGAGAAGPRIILFEKNARAGIKVLVCGGGRCNFTNAGTVEFLIEQFGRNGRFLTPALLGLDNEGLREFFAGLGVPSHVEHDGKVYPNSNQAKSVVDALVRRMNEVGVETLAGSGHAVLALERAADGFVVHTAQGAAYSARIVVLAVGGMSYQRMGTVGDGYRMAESLGHSIVPPRPAIVGLLTRAAEQADGWVKPLQGLAMRDVELQIEGAKTSKGGHGEGRRSVGDLLFTHFGISGPAVLNPSEIVAEMLERQATVEVRVDFIRHMPHDTVHATLRSWQREHGRKRVKTMLSQGQGAEVVIKATSPDQTGITVPVRSEPARLSVPVRLAEAFCAVEGISPEQVCATLNSGQMHQLVERLKRCRFTVTGTRGFKEAMVTAGGVKLGEVNPRTMESKIVPGLFLTGEVLDLTGPSGGYNLQLAFSTGQLAGRAVAERLQSGV